VRLPWFYQHLIFPIHIYS